MRAKRFLSAVAIFCFVAVPMIAQQTPGTIAVLDFQKPKNGMLQQYETGRKQKAAWHKQQNDPLPLFVWEILSGENTGTYIVARMGQHWGDFDKPVISQESDNAEYEKAVASSVDSVVTRYYRFLPKISNPGDMNGPPKFSEIVIFHVRYGKGPDFRAATEQICEAAQKTKWQQHFEWYALANGGPEGEFVLAIPHQNWADFEDNPNVKPFREMLKDAFGQAQTDSIVDRINDSVLGETSEIIQFHPELSYLPAK